MCPASTERRQTKSTSGEVETAVNLEQRIRSAVQEAARSEGPIELDAELAKDIEAYGWFPREFDIHVERLRERYKATRDIEEANELLRQAREVKAPVDPRTLPIANYKTVEEVVEAWENFRGSNDPTCITQSKLCAHELKMRSRTQRTQAETYLLSTCDPAIRQDVAELRKNIQRLKLRMQSRNQIVNLESSIVEQTKRVENILACILANPTGRVGCRDTEDQLQNAKAVLCNLVAQRPEAEKAIADNAKDAKECARMEANIEALCSERMKPERMKWSYPA